MKTVHSLPHAVRDIENAWIPLSDGCRLAARIWLPADADEVPVPAILEYLPYRKRDGTRQRDEPMHAWFAGHGYAALRVDLRGSGDSDGVLLDEYHERELLDALEVLRWIAAQPWCSGAVGMMGKSWGGFNALQVAALRPPELKAVISVCSTDDRYADDAHFMGGCLLNENILWGSVLQAINALPPDPLVVGERWREMWLERIEAAPLFLEKWIAHQRRDDYWKHGSICEDFGRIACPVFAVGGWADGYSNAVPRLLAGLDVPRKGLVGPWGHDYPHDGVPGPAIGFLQEVLAWWDHWLRGVDRGVLDEPAYRVWMQDSVPPRTSSSERPGRWVAEDGWPSARTAWRTSALAAGRILEPGAEVPEGADGVQECVTFSSPETTGLEGGSWCGFGLDGDLPGDQRADDGRSIVFDSEPLLEGFEILGAPRVHVSFSVDRPLALLAVRLGEVAPDGSSARVTYALANLAHRAGHELPEVLVPGRRYAVEVELNDIAHAFPAGHRLRLALSTSYWPTVWPSPESVTLSVFPAACRLDLPVRPRRAEDETLRPFPEPEACASTPVTNLTPAVPRRTFERDLATGDTTLVITLDTDKDGAPALERLDAIDLTHGHAMVERFRIHPRDPLSACAEVVHTAQLARGDWSVRIELSMQLSSTLTEFVIDADLAAFEGETRIAARHWRRTLPRDHV